MRSTMNQKTHRPKQARRVRGPRRSGFILILVVVVVTMASLAALRFAKSMINARAVSGHSNARLQARMSAESAAQHLRLLLAYPRTMRTEMGGLWDNPTFFQAVNIIPHTDPKRRGNYSILSPSMDEFGNYTGIRFGLQNESAKLNLLTLAQLDQLAQSGDMAASALGGDSGDGDALAAMASQATASSELTGELAIGILMALPGMTEEIAYSILDFLDEDDEPRLPYGAEFNDYYSTLPTPYKPANGPINSIEQLLLVRGVTPFHLFGYDLNRNGVLDQSESSMMTMGGMGGTGGMGGGLGAGGGLGTSASTGGSGADSALMPPPLGWAAYLTIHSEEKNVALDGTARININSDDLETLYSDLVTILGNDTWASFIIAYRLGGTPGGNGNSPLTTLATMAAADSDSEAGALGTQLGQLSQASGGGGDQPVQTLPWDPGMLSSMDLSQGGSVQFNQVLDLIDATVQFPQQGGGGGGEQEPPTFASPFTSLPLDLANSTPILMDYLTTVDAPSVPGRINIMECPQEILRGIPGLTDEIADQILEARIDGSDSETRNFETWLVVESYLTMDEMRALLPLVTCGGDVYKAQIVGYMEGDAAFSRIEAIVSGTGDLPLIKFFRRIDHLGRTFDVTTLGQRFDATVPGAAMTRSPSGAGGLGGLSPGGIQ